MRRFLERCLSFPHRGNNGRFPHLISPKNLQGGNTRNDNDDAADSGAVYVFTRTAGSWAQQAYIKASNTGWADVFGYSVALHGDTLAVDRKSVG